MTRRTQLYPRNWKKTAKEGNYRILWYRAQAMLVEWEVTDLLGVTYRLQC